MFTTVTIWCYKLILYCQPLHRRLQIKEYECCTRRQHLAIMYNQSWWASVWRWSGNVRLVDKCSESMILIFKNINQIFRFPMIWPGEKVTDLTQIHRLTRPDFNAGYSIHILYTHICSYLEISYLLHHIIRLIKVMLVISFIASYSYWFN